MNNDIGGVKSRYQQGDAPDLSDQYRAIGIPAISAATLYKARKAKSEQQTQSSAQTYFLEFED